ncbi:MAG: hypothetical protein HY889_07065 [Deltaproteobacteria bacterium]|nr:hypothetical protein [Deltaproteobacteria bacterium]
MSSDLRIEYVAFSKAANGALVMQMEDQCAPSLFQRLIDSTAILVI